MLVVSRRPHDRIVFPGLGITIQVVRVEGKCVRLGIDAPRDVRVLRHEIADQGEPANSPQETAAAQRRHDVRNHLNTAVLTLHLIQQKLRLGEGASDELEPLFARIVHELHALEETNRRAPAQESGPLPAMAAVGALPEESWARVGSG